MVERQRLRWSLRLMLNRLEFSPQPVENLRLHGQRPEVARMVLADLADLGYAAQQDDRWSITDAGVLAAARSGALHATPPHV